MKAKKSKKYLIFGLLLLTIILVGWIYYDKSRWIKLDHPYISKIKITKKRTFVELYDTDYLSKVVDLSAFDGMSPITSLEEAVEMYGDPDNTIREERSTLILEYWRPNSHVNIVSQELSGGGGSDNSYYSYHIRAYPHNTLYYDLLLDNDIISQLQISSGKHFIVFEASNELIMIITLRGARVEKLSR